MTLSTDQNTTSNLTSTDTTTLLLPAMAEIQRQFPELAETLEYTQHVIEQRYEALELYAEMNREIIANIARIDTKIKIAINSKGSYNESVLRDERDGELERLINEPQYIRNTISNCDMTLTDLKTDLLEINYQADVPAEEHNVLSRIIEINFPSAGI